MSTRALHIMDHLSPGGGCVSPLQFAARANQIPGQEHHFLTLGRPERDGIDAPADVAIFDRGRRSLVDCAKWVASAGYDTVHWHWWESSDLIYEFMHHMSGLGGHRRIITCDVYPAAPRYTLGKMEIAYADMLVFDGKDSMLAYAQVPKSKKSYVIGGTSLDTYAVARTRSDDGKFRMGRGSTLSPWKCPPDLIEMVAPILLAVPNAEFHVFGDGRLRPRLWADIRRLGLEDRVFLRGWVRDFEQEVANLDLYLYHLPKVSYASSELNLQGAMAAGLPIVVMPSDGTRWMFEHGEDALVAATPREAEQHCVRLAKDPQERGRLGSQARAKAFREFGVDNMVRAYLEHIYPACPVRSAPSSMSSGAGAGIGGLVTRRLRRAYRAGLRSAGGRVRALLRKVRTLRRKANAMLQALRLGLAPVPPNYFLKSGLDSRCTVVDVGTGPDADFSAGLLRTVAGVRSYGFEPTRKHHPSLDEIVKETAGRFRYFPLALAASPGSRPFFESAANVSGSLFSDHVNVMHDPVTRYDVQAVTIGDVFDLLHIDRIDVLKLDVEGEEYEILGRLDDDALSRVGQLVVEFHHDSVERFTTYDTDRVVSRLQKAGFTTYTADGTNYLFFRRG